MDANRPVVVFLNPGTYRIAAPVEFGPADSHLHFVGVRGGTVVSGGVTLPRFKELRGGLWFVDLPPDLGFEQLWVNGRRAVRAKSPNVGYFYMKEPIGLDVNPVTGGREDLFDRGFVARPEDLVGLIGKTPAELSNVVIRTYNSWYTVATRMQYAGEDGSVIGTATKGRPYFYWKKYLPRYELENYRAALDAPGEWFVDDREHRLLYVPRPGESVDSAIAEVPVVERLMVVGGNRRCGQVVRDLRFENILFDLAGYRMPADGGGGEQSAPEFDATIVVNGSEDVSFDRCSLRRTGHYGFWFRQGCRQCSLTRSLVEDLGAGAVRIGERWALKDDPSVWVTSDIVIEDCILRAGGRIVPSACGIQIYHASDCSVSHNEIADFLYTGVAMGWTWGYGNTHTCRNRINWNHIHDIGQEVLCDLGGIYTLGRSEGTQVVGNHVHDVESYDYTSAGGWGLYADEGSSGICFASNLVHHAKTGAIHQHYGADNLFANNILVGSSGYTIRRSRDEPHHCLTFERNISYQDNREPMWTGKSSKPGERVANVTSISNVWWATSGLAETAFFGRTWESWRAEGQDVGSVVADPCFKDAAHGDYRLRKGSPALEVGFAPWDYTQSGVRGESAWRNRAAERTRVRKTPAVIPELFSGARRICTAFEGSKVGPEGIGPFGISPSGKKGAFELVDRQGVTDGHCLKITDGVRYGNSWEPHLFVWCRADRGVVLARMSIRMSGRAAVVAECRDYGTDAAGRYSVGPGFRLENGRLSAGGKTLSVAVGKWADIEIRADLDASPVTYLVSVRMEDGAHEVLDGLVADKGFGRLRWFGLMSVAQEDCAWWLDDFSIGSQNSTNKERKSR